MLRVSVASCLVILVICGSSAAAMFDWRDIDGQDFTTPVKNQGNTGTCWAFSTTAALESKFEINSNNPDWNLDLSEQHLISSGCCGGIDGGWDVDALAFFVTHGITDETTLPFSRREPSPNWPLTGEFPIYSITSVDINLGDGFLDGGYTTAEVKAALEQHGPLVAVIRTPDDWFIDSEQLGDHFNIDPPPDNVLPGDEQTIGGRSHGVVVVGYIDDETLESGGKWIVKNSWGPNWGDEGYWYVEYGVLESRNWVHALIGDTKVIVIPEPSALLQTALACGVGLTFIRRAF